MAIFCLFFLPKENNNNNNNNNKKKKKKKKKKKNMSGFDLRFKLPSNLLAVGPTSCGKTSWLKKLVENRDIMCSPVPERMILFYKESQPAYTDMERQMNDVDREKRFCKFSHMPESIEDMKYILEMFRRGLPKIVVFDDFLDEVGLVLKHFFTVLTHHYNCLTVFLCQNMFSAKSELRTLSVNSQYMILFNNPRDRSAVSHLAKQVFPGNVHQLNEAYSAATGERPYGYLLMDFHQRQNNSVRLRSHIFPHEQPTRACNVCT